MQDFTVDSKIKWDKSITEIDQQLYEKYSLTQEEIDFIEKMIKPMGDWYERLFRGIKRI